jgi:4-amino-4-deoxy-L-arabinose transferase-like glycosyltransferase
MSSNPPPSAPRPTSGLALVVGTLLVCAPLVAGGQFVAHARVDELDPELFACFGRAWLSGAGLYDTLWDIKPPGIFWINALGLGLGGGSRIGVALLCALALSGSVCAIGILGWRGHGRWVGALGAVLAAVYLPHFDFHVGGNRPVTFVVLCEALALVGYLRAWREPRRRVMFLWLCGAACGSSLLFKQNALALPLALTLHLVWRRRAWADGGGSLVSAISALVGGGWAVLGLGVCGIALRGNLADAWGAIVTVPFAARAGRWGIPLFADWAWMGAHARTLQLPLILAGCVLLWAIWPGRRRGALRVPTGLGAVPPGYIGLLATWLVTAVGLAQVGMHPRGWYLGPALVPLLLLAMVGIHLAVEQLRGSPGGRPAFASLLAGAWLVLMLSQPVRAQFATGMRQYHLQFAADPDPATAHLEATIARYTRTGDAIFLAGYQPGVFWRTERVSASRHWGTVNAEAWTDERAPVLERIVRDLRASPPGLIQWPGIDTHSARGRELANWLATHYVAPDDAPNGVWVRRSSTTINGEALHGP